MVIANYEGRWFDHPFWRSRVALRNERQVAKMHASPIEWVVIDTAEGADVEPEYAASSPAASPPPAMIRGQRRAAQAEPAAPAPAPPRASGAAIARDFGRAGAAIARNEKRVSKVFFEVRLGKTIRAATIEPVISDLLEAVRHNTGAFFGLLMSRRDGDALYRHALAVSGLMITLARQLALPEHEVRLAGMAGLFLDCGTALATPPEIDAVDAHLAGTDPEAEATAESDHAMHVTVGTAFLARSGLDPAVIRATREHHERIDGTGFPAGLTYGEISRLGRMAAICDTYDDLLNPEDGSRVHDPAEAVRALLDGGPGFDPLLLGRFIEAIGVYPAGAFVRLRSGRPALVVSLDPLDTSLPTVMAFQPRHEGGIAAPQLIDLAACYGADAIDSMLDPLECGYDDCQALRDALFAAAAGRKPEPLRQA